MAKATTYLLKINTRVQLTEPVSEPLAIDQPGWRSLHSLQPKQLTVVSNQQQSNKTRLNKELLTTIQR